MDSKAEVTKTVLNSGRLKAEQTFTFPVHYPELAILSIQMRDEDAGEQTHATTPLHTAPHHTAPHRMHA